MHEIETFGETKLHKGRMLNEFVQNFMDFWSKKLYRCSYPKFCPGQKTNFKLSCEMQVPNCIRLKPNHGIYMTLSVK